MTSYWPETHIKDLWEQGDSTFRPRSSQPSESLGSGLKGCSFTDFKTTDCFVPLAYVVRKGPQILEGYISTIVTLPQCLETCAF